MDNLEKTKSPIRRLYMTQDIVAQIYAHPFPSANDQTAIRLFKQLISDPQFEESKNPQDFRLWLIGSMDPDDGQIDILEPYQLIMDGYSFVHKDSKGVSENNLDAVTLT